MAMELVTGYAGKAHVTSYQDAAIQAGIVGVDNGVLSYVGQGMKAVATSANNIRIYDGVALIGGKAVVIDRDTYQDVAIANGTVGKYRNDIIYIKYTKDAFTGVESVTFDVKQGAAGNSGIDPALTTNNLYSTGTLTSEIPFKRVRLNGLAIESVENMHDNVPSLTELNRKLILYEWETTVKPFASINPGNKLTFTVRKIGRVCTGNILWVGSVSGTNATLTDFTIPEPFRPIKTEYYSASLISSGKVFGSSRLDISNLGKVTYATDQEGFVERYVSFSYIGNDITPDEMYLVDNL